MANHSDIYDCELSQRLGADGALVQKLLKRFSANLPILIVRLSLALKSGDAPRAYSQISMLQEVAKSIGARDLSKQLSTLNTLLEEFPVDQWLSFQQNIENIALGFRNHLQQRFSIAVPNCPDT